MKKAKAKRPPTYRVTQPQLEMNYDPAFPAVTTRVSSNDRYILAANHPDWYFTAAREEERMLSFLSAARLRAAFAQNAALLQTDPPAGVYAYVLIALLRAYVAQYLPGDETIRQVFNHAVFTVVTNLRRDVFADPRDLTGNAYTSADFAVWAENLERFLALDAFTYRPPESGHDIDGKRKPIVETCPTPKLGRHLVRCGYELLRDLMAARFPEAATASASRRQRGIGEE